jgi:YidC/Oxa1 family membrane protein insertase
MAAMKKIQPKLKEIQDKHKKDPKKLQQEMMVLYKEHGVNPFSGCLPLLIQLPIMIGLYATLSAPEFLHKTAGKGFLWIQNISFVETLDFGKIAATHPLASMVSALGLHGLNTSFVVSGFALPLLAVLVAITTYYSQKSMDLPKEQQSLMVFMPIMMYFICQSLNAGVLLYWVVSNVLTTVQQLYIQKGKTVTDDVTIVEVDRIEDKPKKKKQER